GAGLIFALRVQDVHTHTHTHTHAHKHAHTRTHHHTPQHSAHTPTHPHPPHRDTPTHTQQPRHRVQALPPTVTNLPPVCCRTRQAPSISCCRGELSCHRDNHGRLRAESISTNCVE